MKELLASKKFKMAVAGVIVAVAAKFGLDLDTQAILVVLAPILVFIGAQGVADMGKEKAKIEDNGKKDLVNHLMTEAKKASGGG